MFGISQIRDIAEGWTNYALGKENELSEQRMKICRQCKLYNVETDRCDSRRCLNLKTNELVQVPGKDVICGCNCVMQAKTRLERAKCIMSKW